MRVFIPKLLFACLALFSAFELRAKTVQDNADSTIAVSNKALHFISAKYGRINDAVEKQSIKLLQRLQKKESKLQDRMNGVDSVKAQQLFAGTQTRYQQLQTKMQTISSLPSSQSLHEYLPAVDSITTTLKFLSGKANALSGNTQNIQNGLAQMQQLQAKLQTANEIQDYVRERETYLKQQLQNTPLAKAVTGINKEVYYYQQRLVEYKTLINNPEKLGEKILSTVSGMPAFQKFFQKNSYLSQLFRMPGTDITPDAVAGLQTRSSVQNILNQRIGAATAAMGSNPEQYMTQQMQTAQSQIDAVKDKLNNLGGGGNSDMAMPDFKVNNQHTKTFLHRLEYGFNIQSQKSSGLLPATSNLAISVGYKFSDSKTVGIGASYNLGLGNGFNHIKFTNEGVGLRSFADIKVKGSFWATGGYEYTYYQAFAKLSDIRNLDTWQRSALIGITKKYTISKNRQGNLQLLYDFLADKEIPRGQPLKFRLGYTF